MASINWTNDGVVDCNLKLEDWVPVDSYRCHVLLISEDDNTLSGVVLNLPGAGSCGATEEETLGNVKEAVKGVIDSYRRSGKAIPWIDSRESKIPEGARQKWILVNA
jgi:predicted RNase H-like HicB family nuclease